jgi:hypothetical protein
MLQYAAHASLLTSLPIVDEVLDIHASQLGPDRAAYRNHVYRVVNLTVAIVGKARLELEKIAIAAVFHDLGIWTNNTFDYIAPSVALAREHLAGRGMADWVPEIEAMIADHHKITPTRAHPQSLVESFRRADWIDRHPDDVPVPLDFWRMLMDKGFGRLQNEISFNSFRHMPCSFEHEPQSSGWPSRLPASPDADHHRFHLLNVSGRAADE